ncbi:hypothetical protein SHK09_00975 [Polaribacter sp. PL03]|uniref:hypothetical protein n=1 Tax=Polaribacter sp. PL03 TaxID=3088353 RepID=UPI0029D14CA1|nr:hypothetical protein [Polaribacter sp. PL03]MDX6745347.1 hypothetical protein [Polaribacter sp. PL03]
MKNRINALGIATLLLATTINLYSQNIAMVHVPENATEQYSEDFDSANIALKDGNYTYKLGSNDISISIKDGYYIENHPNNEFIKAKIDWTSADEYTLTIVEINKKDIPFRKGTMLNTKITKVRGDKYYYKSDLLDSHNSSWTGKLKKIEEDGLLQ